MQQLPIWLGPMTGTDGSGVGDDPEAARPGDDFAALPEEEPDGSAVIAAPVEDDSDAVIPESMEGAEELEEFDEIADISSIDKIAGQEAGVPVEEAEPLEEFGDISGEMDLFSSAGEIEELESAGVACLTIEDTLLPQGFGRTGAEFLEIDEGVGKMKAALAARQDAQMIVDV